MEALVDALLGPQGVAAAALIAVTVLWRRHSKDDDSKDAAIKVLTGTVAAYPLALSDLTKVVVDQAEREHNRPRNERAHDT